MPIQLVEQSNNPQLRLFGLEYNFQTRYELWERFSQQCEEQLKMASWETATSTESVVAVVDDGTQPMTIINVEPDHFILVIGPVTLPMVMALNDHQLINDSRIRHTLNTHLGDNSLNLGLKIYYF